MSDIGCRVENCPVASTGACLEAFSPPEECPNYLSDISDEEGQRPEPVEVEAVEPDGPSMESLPDGESLTGTSLAQVTYRTPCTLLVIAGPVGSGKTTLLVGLYEAFHRGPFASFNFAGSQTLRAFEERCHLSRITSGKAEADTARTPRAQALPFLHLALRKGEAQHDLLLSDLSGEAFDDVVNSLDSARGLMELRRADHFLIMLDGARLINPTQRQGHLRDVRTALRSLIQEGTLRPPTVIHLAVSKWDQVVREPNHAQLIERGVTQLHTQLNPFKVVQHKVAARSKPGSTVVDGYGLDELLRSVVGRRGVRRSVFETDKPDAGREYLRYGRYRIHPKDELL